MSTMMNDELREYLQNDIGAMTEDSLRRMRERLIDIGTIAQDGRARRFTTPTRAARGSEQYLQALSDLSRRLR